MQEQQTQVPPKQQKLEDKGNTALETQDRDRRLSTTVSVGAGIVVQNIEDLKTISKWVVESGLAPKNIKTPQQAFVCIAHGMEVGFKPMQSLQCIAPINGIPGIYGDGALALVRNSGLCEYYREREIGTIPKPGTAKKDFPDDYGWEAVSKRRDEKEPVVTVFTVADAKQAGLWGKDGTWQNYTKRMLKWKPRGWNLRDNFPEVLKGMKLVEELQDYPEPAEFTIEDDNPQGVANQAAAILGGGQQKFGEQVDTETGEITKEPDPDMSLDEQAFAELREYAESRGWPLSHIVDLAEQHADTLGYDADRGELWQQEGICQVMRDDILPALINPVDLQRIQDALSAIGVAGDAVQTWATGRWGVAHLEFLPADRVEQALTDIQQAAQEDGKRGRKK